MPRTTKTPKGAATKRGLHPNSLKNLKRPWPPGTSGNPAGRVPTDKELLAALALEGPNSIATLVELRDSTKTAKTLRAHIATTILQEVIPRKRVLAGDADAPIRIDLKGTPADELRSLIAGLAATGPASSSAPASSTTGTSPSVTDGLHPVGVPNPTKGAADT